jgi:hypothetical protein
MVIIEIEDQKLEIGSYFQKKNNTEVDYEKPAWFWYLEKLTHTYLFWYFEKHTHPLIDWPPHCTVHKVSIQVRDDKDLILQNSIKNFTYLLYTFFVHIYIHYKKDWYISNFNHFYLPSCIFTIKKKCIFFSYLINLVVYTHYIF